VTAANVYFAKTAPSALAEVGNVDLIYYIQSREPSTGAQEFPTLHVDLRVDEATIFSRMAKGTRYEIRRAEQKDGLDFSLMRAPSTEQLRQFCESYNSFAKTKGLASSSTAMLTALARSNGLTLSLIRGADNKPLSWHAYIVDGERARLLHSASHFRGLADSSQRSLVGRANRYLHWLDIKTFKQLGFSIFDLGGIAAGAKGYELDGVDEFKRGFGGVDVVEYNYYQPRSLVGKLTSLRHRAQS
jgi:hypothetical protein